MHFALATRCSLGMLPVLCSIFGLRGGNCCRAPCCKPQHATEANSVGAEALELFVQNSFLIACPALLTCLHQPQTTSCQATATSAGGQQAAPPACRDLLPPPTAEPGAIFVCEHGAHAACSAAGSVPCCLAGFLISCVCCIRHKAPLAAICGPVSKAVWCVGDGMWHVTAAQSLKRAAGVLVS